MSRHIIFVLRVHIHISTIVQEESHFGEGLKMRLKLFFIIMTIWYSFMLFTKRSLKFRNYFGSKISSSSFLTAVKIVDFLASDLRCHFWRNYSYIYYKSELQFCHELRFRVCRIFLPLNIFWYLPNILKGLESAVFTLINALFHCMNIVESVARFVWTNIIFLIMVKNSTFDIWQMHPRLNIWRAFMCTMWNMYASPLSQSQAWSILPHLIIMK
jgi:hypothetical protein